MTMAENSIRCDVCGRFISLNDLADERASHKLIYPDSDRSAETWESLCKQCAAKDQIRRDVTRCSFPARCARRLGAGDANPLPRLIQAHNRVGNHPMLDRIIHQNIRDQ